MLNYLSGPRGFRMLKESIKEGYVNISRCDPEAVPGCSCSALRLLDQAISQMTGSI